MTQYEIEKEFDESSLREDMQEKYAEFVALVQDEHLLAVRNALQTKNDDDVTNFLLDLITLIGNPELGTEQEDGTRLITVHSAISALSKSKAISSDVEPEEAFEKSANTIVELDGIFYDIVQEKKLLQSGDWSTQTYLQVAFSMEMNDLLRAKYTFYRMPMIEVPDKWTKSSNGGYKINKSNMVMGRGEQDQPDNIKEVLNILQENSFKLAKHVNIQDYKNYLINKLTEKGYSFETIEEIVANSTLTHDDCYQFMQDKEFYFEWRYDFRGRIYSSGYQINLQSDSYTKGIILKGN